MSFVPRQYNGFSNDIDGFFFLLFILELEILESFFLNLMVFFCVIWFDFTLNTRTTHTVMHSSTFRGKGAGRKGRIFKAEEYPASTNDLFFSLSNNVGA